MKESPSDPGYGRTNWRRFGLTLGVPTVVAAGLVVAFAQGALAASFQVSGQNFKLSADHLDGYGFTQYTQVQPQSSNENLGKGNGNITAMSGIDHAYIKNLCQSVNAGPITMRIEAGKSDDEQNQAYAEQLLIGMSDLQGDATFKNIQIGVDSNTMTDDGQPGPSHGNPSTVVGAFGQQAEHVDIDNLKQTATMTSAGKFQLKGMHLHLYVGGSHECFTDAPAS